MPIALAPYAVAMVVTLVAAITDMRTGRIPNWLTYPLLVAAPIASGLIGGAEPFLRSLLGVVLCGAVPLLLFMRGAMGGGDVKLFAVLGGILGPAGGVEVQFFAYVAVTFLLLARMAWDGKLLNTLGNVGRAGFNLVVPDRFQKPLEPSMLTTMRMGLAIFVATLWSFYINNPSGLF
jgi:prepilin peptidase CpaA